MTIQSTDQKPPYIGQITIEFTGQKPPYTGQITTQFTGRKPPYAGQVIMFHGLPAGNQPVMSIPLDPAGNRTSVFVSQYRLNCRSGFDSKPKQIQTRN